MAIVAGVDPGRFGAITILKVSKKVEVIECLWLGDCNNATNIYNKVKGWDWESVSNCYIEQVHAMPGEGVGSSFKFGMSYGLLTMLLTILVRQPKAIAPVAWMRPFSVGIPDAIVGKKRNKYMLDRIMSHSFKRDGEWDAILIAVGGYLRESKKVLKYGDYTTLKERSNIDFSNIHRREGDAS